MEKFDLADETKHDSRTNRELVFISVVFETITILGGLCSIFYLRLYFLASILLCNSLFYLFMFPRNYRLLKDFFYYGLIDNYEVGPFIKHGLVLFSIELTIILACLPFLDTSYYVFVAISMAVLLALILLLVMERSTYFAVRENLNLNKGLVIHKEE